MLAETINSELFLSVAAIQAVMLEKKTRAASNSVPRTRRI